VEVSINALDNMGSILWANNNGSPPTGFAYSPFGSTPARNANNCMLPGFNGERLDPVCQTYHLGNGYRTYNPVLMRANAPDSWSPFGAGGLNQYAYCEGDPINRSDPSGHMSWQAGLGLGLGILGMLGSVFTFGQSLTAAAAAEAAMTASMAADLTATGLGVAASVTSVASATTQESNPEASRILGWISFSLGIASVGVHAGNRVYGKIKKSAPYERLAGTNEIHNHPTTRSEIIDRGIHLGSGAVGSAYKVDVGTAGAPKHMVYKIYHKAPKPFEAPSRVAKVWNEFYSSAYRETNPEFSAFLKTNFANAEMVKLNDGSEVLKTPFITGVNDHDYDYEKQLSDELYTFFNRTMHDLNDGNIKIINFNNVKYAVPIDFDLVISDLTPSRGGSFSSNYFHDDYYPSDE